MKAKLIFLIFSVLGPTIIVLLATIVNPIWWWAFVVMGPIILLGMHDITQTRHTINRNFPVLGHFRYLLEDIRPEIMQYFVETDTEGRPIPRIFRSMIYQRAKKVNDTTPFGTQFDVYAEGYEWMDYSIYPKDEDDLNHNPRVRIGGSDCTQPYDAALLNISAMSFGSLSDRAIMAMNLGAKMSGFFQNTGEGGVSHYHLKHGGDLVWQVGTGYFGCRRADGGFSEEKYKENAQRPEVKMIEIKLSQGAKPGHGGILPAVKNTKEIAEIRGVEPHTTVYSPPFHKAFEGAEGLMHFVARLRKLSGGKPVGFKLCIGRKVEFVALCQAMISTGIKPDFISIDGGEGGTGAAPVEFSNSIGMPMRDGLAFAKDVLDGFDLKKDIKLIASGKILTGYHMVRAIALGADICNSARAMMMAVGCIQALKCNNNTCPVGVATQDKGLVNGLVVEDKAKRVKNFHHATVGSFVEMVAAAGINSSAEIKRMHINRRVFMDTIKRYDEIYPCVPVGSFLKDSTIPKQYQELLARIQISA